RDSQGRFSLAGVKPSDADAESPSPLLWLSDTGDPNAPNAHLRRITIRDAEIALDDRVSTSKWRATHADLELRRREGRLEGDLRGEFTVRLEAAVMRLPLQARAAVVVGESATLRSATF